ncbi:MAG: Rieske (2Fe-2S) protein [Haloarculaceae archaeon]
MEEIVPVDDVEADDTVLYRVREHGSDEEREAILIRIDGTVASWLNYCQHFTHIRLDKGDGAPVRDGEIVCANHGAMFDAGTGLCTFGPCEGAYLTPVEVTTRDGTVYLADDDYEFVGLGPIETDEFDLSSTSNVEF